MIITRSPLRVSLFGGGTDHPEYFCRYEGAVMGGAIDKYCYITLNNLYTDFFEYQTKISYSKIELVKQIEDVEHNIFRECLLESQINGGIALHSVFDLPALSGLGTSSALAVATIHALAAYLGTSVSRRELARKAIFVERERVKACVGYQDQIFAAYGGFNLIKFSGDDAFEVTNIAMTDEYLELLNAHSVLVYTGQQRDSTTVASAQVSNIDKNLGILAEMKSFVNEAVKLFNSQSSMREIGRLLNESWRAKSKLASNISNSEIERLYEAGIKCGAYGGKLLGAGAGGFLYFLADKEAQDRLKSVLTNSTLIPLRFGAEGSKIIHEG